MQASSDDDKRKVEEFRKLLGSRDDTASIYSRLWKICQKSLFKDEIEDAEDICQDVVIDLFVEYLKGQIENLWGLCVRIAKVKIDEYRRMKSASINYMELARDLRTLISAAFPTKSNDQFTPIAQKLITRLTDRDQSVIDENLVFNQLMELIKIERTNPQSAAQETHKTLKLWKEQLRKKIKENAIRTVNSGSEDDENEGEFRPFEIENIIDPQKNPEDALNDKKIAGQLYDCLGKLSPKLRETVYLREVEEMDYEDIKRITGRAIGTLHGQGVQAKIALRKCLEKAGIKRG